MSSVHKNRTSDKRKKALGTPTPQQSDGGASQQIDWREQTFNDGSVGQIQQVSTPVDLIVRQKKIMVDIDPKYLNEGLFVDGKGTQATRLYNQTVRQWLDRHPLWKKAEVRHTGTGLHALLHLEPAVEFETAADRERWKAIVRVMQYSLPSDPNAPGLTALTRPIGSINSKNNQKVKRLRAGEPVAPEEIQQFVANLRKRPFTTINGILHGTDRVSPCPVCAIPGSTMAAMDRVGCCYAKCGKVSLAQLLGVFMSNSSTGGN